MDEWIYRQEAWTHLAEQLGEECLVTLESILATDGREFEMRDASVLLAQLILSDAATRYWSSNTGQHDARKKEAHKKIRGTSNGLLKGGDQAEYLQETSRGLGRYVRLGGVPVDEYREIIAFATGNDVSATTSFVSDLIVQIERLSDIAYTLFKKTGQAGNSPTGSGTPRLRLQFSEGEKRTGISTRKPPKSKSGETAKP